MELRTEEIIVDDQNSIKVRMTKDEEKKMFIVSAMDWFESDDRHAHGTEKLIQYFSDQKAADKYMDDLIVKWSETK
jgi:uncharacterized protein involved in tellurium resistance